MLQRNITAAQAWRFSFLRKRTGISRSILLPLHSNKASASPSSTLRSRFLAVQPVEFVDAANDGTCHSIMISLAACVRRKCTTVRVPRGIFSARVCPFRRAKKPIAPSGMGARVHAAVTAVEEPELQPLHDPSGTSKKRRTGWLPCITPRR